MEVPLPYVEGSETRAFAAKRVLPTSQRQSTLKSSSASSEGGEFEKIHTVALEAKPETEQPPPGFLKLSARCIKGFYPFCVLW